MKILHPTDFSDCAQQAEAAQPTSSEARREIVLLQVLVETALYGEGILSVPKVRAVYDAQREVDGGGARGAGHFTSPARDKGELAGESRCAVRGDRQESPGRSALT